MEEVFFSHPGGIWYSHITIYTPSKIINNSPNRPNAFNYQKLKKYNTWKNTLDKLMS